MISSKANRHYTEQEVIRLFAKVWHEFPKGKLIKSESPDFILKHNPKHGVGIEITKLDLIYHGYGKQRLNHGNWNHSNLFLNERLWLLKELIESTIARKEAKLKLYQKKRLNAYWLIMTLNQDELPERQRFTEMFENLQIESAFNKIFLFIIPDYKVLELI